MKTLEVPVARWLHGGQDYPIQLASTHGSDIIGYLLLDLGLPKSHLAKHTAWWLLPEKDKRKLPDYQILEELQDFNDNSNLTLKMRQKYISTGLRQLGYKVRWI